MAIASDDGVIAEPIDGGDETKPPAPGSLLETQQVTTNPGSIALQLKVPNLDGKPRVMVTTAQGQQIQEVQSLESTLVFKELPLAEVEVEIEYEFDGKIVRREMMKTRDILMLAYAESEIPQLVEDGRDLEQERIFLAKRHNRMHVAEIERKRKELEFFEKLGTIEIPVKS